MYFDGALLAANFGEGDANGSRGISPGEGTHCRSIKTGTLNCAGDGSNAEWTPDLSSEAIPLGDTK